MRPDNAVPDVQLLKRFLLGELSRAESGPIEHYLEQHPEIASTLADLIKEDTLVSWLRDSACQPVADPPELAGLMDKLARLRPASEDATQGLTNEDNANDESGSVLAPPQAADEIGRLGGYRVLKVLGVGGMGMVYQAEDVHLQRPIALKVMKAEVARNPTARERFLREARAAARLKSDHVVTIHHVGEERQVVFLAMEFLEGMSLDDWLKKGRKPTLAQAARMGRQIALGLADAHACGLIHRDIKPGNIWLENTHQGRVKLLDFGLARGSAEEVHLTQSGAIVGTPAYMAPEQARGEHVDPRCDLFSLGVVLYRLTTGRLPFRGDNTMSILTSLALDTPPAPRQIDPDIPPRMASLIERLLSKDRKKRPATAKAVAEELVAIEREATQPAAEDRTLQIRAASAAPIIRAEHVAQRSKRFRWLIAASLLVLLGGVTAAIVVIIRDKDGNKVAEIDVPPGGSAEIKDKDEGKANAPPKQKGDIAVAALPPLLPGEPLSPMALVRQPAKLPGVRSWTIEPRVLKQCTSMAYSRDGKRLAVGTYDGRIHIWEPQSGRLVQVLLLDTLSTQVYSLAWSPGGLCLAAGISGDRPIRVWDTQTWRVRALPESLGFECSQIDLLAWSAQGETVFAYSSNPRYSLAWNPDNGKVLRKVEVANGPDPGKPAVLSPDGKRLLGTRPGIDGVVAWDMESGKEIGKVCDCKGGVRGLAISPDGKYLAWGLDDGVHVADAGSGKEIVSRKLALNPGMPIQCSWSPDGKFLEVTSPGLTHVLLDARTKDYATLWQDVLAYHHETPLAWSPDSKAFALTDNAGAVCLLEAGTGKRLRTLSAAFGADPRPLDCSLSPDGRTLALADRSRTFLAATDTGQPIANLPEKTYNTACWSPDGKSLAACQPDGTVMLWEDNGKTRIPLKGHQAPVWWLAWSPDSKRLASSSPDEKRVLVWDAEKGEQFREVGPFAARAEWVTWSPDGRLLAFRIPKVGWHVWDLDRNKLANDPRRWSGHNFQFAPDSRSAVVSDAAGQPYRLRDLTTAEDRGPVSSDCKCVRDDVPLVFSRDGRLLATPLWSSDIALLRGDLRGRVKTLKGTLTPYHSWRYEFSQDGKLMMGVAGEYVHLWETDTGRLRGILLPRECYHGLTITPDGHYTGDDQVERSIVMVVQKDDGTQEVLEPADFEQKYGWKNDPNKVHLLQPLPPPASPLPGMPMGPNALVREPAELSDANAMSWTIETVNARGRVNAVAYRPDGKLLASGGGDGTIRLWDTSSGKLIRMLVGDPVGSLSWSKDGKVLIALHPDFQVREWDADTGRLLRRVIGTVTPETKTARSPDGKQTATADDKGVRITDTATGKVLHTLKETGQVRYYGLSWSPDGRELALGYQFSGESGLRIVEAATERSRPLPANYERAGAWSPDGKTFAAIGHDSRVHLMDAATYRVVRTLEGKFGGYALSWSADGMHLAGSTLEGLQVWSVESGKQRWKSDKPAHNAVWSPDATKLASNDANLNGRVRIYQAETGKLVRELPLQSSVLSWSPDGKFLVAGVQDLSEAQVIEADSGAVKFRLKGGVFRLRSVRWSSDGKTFTTLDSHGLLRVWDAATGQARRTLGVIGNISSAAWSSDGQVLVGEFGGTIRLHDAAGGPLGVLMPLGPYAQLAVTADGRYRGSARVERLIRMVVQKRDGTTETLTPGEFEQKYGFKNDPATVRLTDR